MDCEKFEPLLLDELYQELDEVTSAAVKRHVSGCARCGPILDGMRETQRRAVLPMLALPDGLEDRILASVREAQKVVRPTVHSRAARALSWAGSWAMRPQTAMAAVFLLMIGTSAFVIRSRSASDRGEQAVSVTEQGQPAAAAPGGPVDQESLDNTAAAAAHGPNQPMQTAPPLATASPTAASSAVAMNADPLSMNGITGGKGRIGADDDTSAFGSALFADKADKNEEKPVKKDEAAAEKKSAARGAPSDVTNAGLPGGRDLDRASDPSTASQSVTPPATRTAQADPQDGFSAGMAAYRARNFAEATRQFDSAAHSGDLNSALWAAKAVKDGNGGCGAAVPRFDAVSQKAGATWVGNEAQLEAARCQIAMGQLAPARDRLSRLVNVPSHAAAAQQALNELNQVATRREAERSKAAGGGGRPATAAPMPAPAKPAAKPTDQAGF